MKSPLPDGRQDDDESALWCAFKQKGSAAARERLFSHHANFARNIARRHYRERSRGDIELGDLVQLAYAGLLEALDRFDPDYGTPFRPFAAHRISGSISDGVVKMTEAREQMAWKRRVRQERLRSLADARTGQKTITEAMEAMAEIAVGLALGFILEGTGLFEQGESETRPATETTAYDTMAWKETVAQLHAELEMLTERERTILRLHYIDGANFDQLAVLLQITRGRVSQLHRAALLVLKKRMRERGHFRMER